MNKPDPKPRAERRRLVCGSVQARFGIGLFITLARKVAPDDQKQIHDQPKRQIQGQQKKHHNGKPKIKIMPIDIESFSLGAVAGGVVVGLVVGLANHFLAKDRASRDRTATIINDASTVFRNAFIEEINFLKNAEDPIHPIEDTAFGVLEAALSKHRSAYESFRIVLPDRRRRSIDRAWEEYLYPEGDKESAPCPLIDYAEGNEPEQREKAHHKILALLKFAKIG